MSQGDKWKCLLLLREILPDGGSPEVDLAIANSDLLLQGVRDVLALYDAPPKLLAILDLEIAHSLKMLKTVGLGEKRAMPPPYQKKPIHKHELKHELQVTPERESQTMPDTNEKTREEERLINTMDITRTGSSLVLPEGLPIPLAIKALKRKQEIEEEVTEFNYTFKVSVPEGVVAFLRVLKSEFGFISTQPNFFGKTHYLDIEVAPGVKESVPWGNLEVPKIEGTLSPGFAINRDRVVFNITGKIKGKSRDEAMRICRLVEDECQSSSIYKGQAISTGFPSLRNNEIDSLEASFPQFLKYPSYTEGQLIFSKDIEEQIEANIFTPIKKTGRCRQEGISLKRSALLYGIFGVGKTLTATVTANLCKSHGWTFIYLTDVTRLAQAYDFARQFQPALIFSEDVDKALSGERDLDMDKILNKMDGIDTKGIEVITVMTTNRMEDITQAALRPGRFDALIHVTPPDAEAVTRLIQLYAGDRLAPDQDLMEVGAVLDGAIPAFIEEVVKRSKLAALRRDEDVVQLRTEDLLIVARGMQHHLKLLEPKVEDLRSDEERAAQIVADGHVKAARIAMGLPEEAPTNGKVLPKREHLQAHGEA
jgi:transitional endoplasmic reticulum ATPase